MNTDNDVQPVQDWVTVVRQRDKIVLRDHDTDSQYLSGETGETGETGHNTHCTLYCDGPQEQNNHTNCKVSSVIFSL